MKQVIYLLITLLLLPNIASAATTPSPAEESSWYYEIGGASAATLPPNYINQTYSVGIGADWTIGYSCGKFDPLLSVTNTLNDIKTGAENLVDQMVTAATSAIASLPALILQRANPGLYDLFQNSLLRAEEKFNLATKTCEQMEQEIAEGKNPFDEWIVLSKGSDWRVAMGTGGASTNDAVQTRNSIELNPGVNGITWACGTKAGGASQPPIRLISDIGKTGYNYLLGRVCNNGGSFAPTGPTTPRIAEIWTSPSLFTAWLVEVLGDKNITTCDSCSKDTIPGNGLLLKLNEDFNVIQTDLINLVTGTTPWTLINLEKVSAPGTAVTRDIIESIQEMPQNEQPIAVGKLANEIALSRTVEKALLARRALLAGIRDPNVSATPAIKQMYGEVIPELEREIDNLIFESDIRSKVVGHTASALLRNAQERRSQMLRQPNIPNVTIKPMSDGSTSP